MAEQQQQERTEGFGEAADAPVTEMIGGKPVEFRVLEIGDLTAIARQAAARLADKALAELPLTASAEQRDSVRRYYADREPDVNGLSALTQELNGCKLFLRRELCPSGVVTKEALAAAEPIIARIVKEKGWRGAANLAARFSGLFAPEKKDAAKDAKQDAADPNAGAAGESTLD